MSNSSHDDAAREHRLTTDALAGDAARIRGDWELALPNLNRAMTDEEAEDFKRRWLAAYSTSRHRHATVWNPPNRDVVIRSPANRWHAWLHRLTQRPWLSYWLRWIKPRMVDHPAAEVRPAGILEVPHPLTEEQAEKIRQRWQKLRADRRRHG